MHSLSSDYFDTDAVVQSCDHGWTEIVAPSSDHYGIDMVVPPSDRCYTETVPPSSDNYCTKKVAPPSDYSEEKFTKKSGYATGLGAILYP